MKLIIDIPEEVYKRMMNGDLPIYMAYKYVKNGTPLDDIEHEIRKYLEDECINENEANGIMFCLDIIDKHIGKESE